MGFGRNFMKLSIRKENAQTASMHGRFNVSARAFFCRTISILFVNNGMAASCLKVQQMALVNIVCTILPPNFLVNLNLAPSVGYRLNLVPQREFLA